VAVGALLVPVVLVSGRPQAAPWRQAAEPPPFRIVRAEAIVPHPVAPPASRGPRADASDLVFLDRRHGFLAVAATGAHFDGSGTGRIEETADGGVTWTTVWSRPRTAVTRIGTADSQHLFAIAATYPPGAPQQQAPVPLLLVSGVNARSWRALRPRLPPVAAEVWAWLDFRFANARVGYAQHDPDESAFPIPNGLLRTDDGGRHWRLLRPRGLFLGGFDFLDAKNGFAVGSRRRPASSCQGAVFATRDGGAHWRLLPTSCRPYELTAVDFLNAQTGFAGGGEPYYVGDRPFQALLATRDSGRSWRTVYRGRVDQRTGLPLDRLAFADARRGFAVSAGCKMGENGPCGGPLLATSDGGRHWRGTGQEATRVALVDADNLWLGPVCGCGGVLWRSADGGRRWQPLARPENADSNAVVAAGSWLLLQTGAGMFRSRDGGRSWSAFLPPVAPGASPYGQRIAQPGLLADVDERVIHISHDGGRSWRQAALPITPGSGIGAVAFADPLHGIAAQEGFGCLKGGGLVASRLFATSDGGTSWQPLPTPAFAVGQLVAVPGLAAAVARGAACGSQWLALSRDGGHTWSLSALPHRRLDCAPSLAPPEKVWLACGHTLLTSSDGGSTWTELTGTLAIDTATPTSGGDGWLTGSLRGAEGRSLWTTDDGGRTWAQQWPALPIPGWRSRRG
jgi:photosystem II stability/assembly factor-like uncharacterized protein